MENGPSDVKLPKIRQEAGKTALLTDNRPKSVRKPAKTPVLTENRPKSVRKPWRLPAAVALGLWAMRRDQPGIRGGGKPTRLPINGVSIICH